MSQNLFLNTNDTSFNSGLLKENTKNNINNFLHYAPLMKKNVPNNNFYNNTFSNIQNNRSIVCYANTDINYSYNNFCTCFNHSNEINPNIINLQKKSKKKI